MTSSKVILLSKAPEVSSEYEALRPEMEVIRAQIKARIKQIYTEEQPSNSTIRSGERSRSFFDGVLTRLNARQAASTTQNEEIPIPPLKRL